MPEEEEESFEDFEQSTDANLTDILEQDSKGDTVSDGLDAALSRASDDEKVAGLQLAAKHGLASHLKTMLPVVYKLDDGPEAAASALVAGAFNGKTRATRDIARFMKANPVDRAPTLLQEAAQRALEQAAKAGHGEIVMDMLEEGADKTAKNSDGQTPAMVAQAAGHLDLVAVLGDPASPTPAPAAEPDVMKQPATQGMEGLTAPKPAPVELPEEPEEPASPPTPEPAAPASAEPVAAPESPSLPSPSPSPESPAAPTAPSPDPSPMERRSVALEEPTVAPKPVPKKQKPAPKKEPKRSSSEPKLSTQDKFRPESSDGAPATRRHPLYNQGVVSGTRSMPYMVSFSNYASSPKWSFRNRDSLPQKQRKFDQPGPGAYTVTNVDKFKYNGGARFGFGTGPRFQADSSKQPGPGAYSPFDPSLGHGARFGFGTSLRSAGKSTVHETPPPGTYDIRSDMGRGQSWTARGKPKGMVEAGMESPGPGAYTPNMKVYEHGARFSFGNAGREGLVKSSERECPGPGAYAVSKTLGHDSHKFSIVSRPLGWDAPGTEQRRSPGPGSYNAHITSFGY